MSSSELGLSFLSLWGELLSFGGGDCGFFCGLGLLGFFSGSSLIPNSLLTSLISCSNCWIFCSEPLSPLPRLLICCSNFGKIVSNLCFCDL